MRYFSIEELVRSKTASDLGINNTPDETVKANLVSLVDNVLDPAREVYGNPVTVTSGYRCPELNSALSGSKTSQHMSGLAADLVCDNNKLLFEIIKAQDNFDQLIWENNGQWVHVSWAGSNNRKQVLYL